MTCRLDPRVGVCRNSTHHQFSEAKTWRVLALLLTYCMQSTNVRLAVSTKQELKRLAPEFGATVGATIAIAVRCLRQDRMGAGLRTD